MYRLFYLLLSSVILLQSTKCAKIYLEGTQKKYSISLPYPVIDGNDIRNNTAHTLEILSLEENDNDKSLIKVANFPKLQYINLSSIELEVVPIFENLPILELVVLEYNFITKITAKSFAKLPKVLQYYFTSNTIQEIEDNTFGKSVFEVNLDCNILNRVNKSWFQYPSSIKILSVRNNKISALDENLFQDFLNLKTIDFSNNEISTIGNNAFIGSNYHLLSIHTNQINELNSTMFSSSNVTINTFNIGRNRLSFLAQSFLDKLNVIRFLIFGNPWQCPCLKKITDWIITSSVNSTIFASDRLIWSANNPVCIYALSFSKRCVEIVDNELYDSYIESLVNLDTKRFC